MHVNPANPVIVQGDGKVLLETKHPKSDVARDFGSLAELNRLPTLAHHRISPLSLWNAASSGMTRGNRRPIAGPFEFDIPKEVLTHIDDTISRFGLVQLHQHPDGDRNWLRVTFATAYVEKLIKQTGPGKEHLVQDGKRYWKVNTGMRGIFKQRMLLENWPVEDLAGFTDGDALPFDLRDTMRGGGAFQPRDYQFQAVERWYRDGHPAGGHGVVVLPCGAGKTIAALTAMTKVSQHTRRATTKRRSVNGCVNVWTKPQFVKIRLHLFAQVSKFNPTPWQRIRC